MRFCYIFRGYPPLFRTLAEHESSRIAFAVKTLKMTFCSFYSVLPLCSLHWLPPLSRKPNTHDEPLYPSLSLKIRKALRGACLWIFKASDREDLSNITTKVKRCVEKWFADMPRVLDIFLAWILILFLQIERGGGKIFCIQIHDRISPIIYLIRSFDFVGSCSSAKKAECAAIWRTCRNEHCGECMIEIDGECFSKFNTNEIA